MNKKIISKEELLTCDLKIEHKLSSDWFLMFQNSKGDIWFTDEKFNKIELPLNPTTIENKEKKLGVDGVMIWLKKELPKNFKFEYDVTPTSKSGFFLLFFCSFLTFFLLLTVLFHSFVNTFMVCRISHERGK